MGSRVISLSAFYHTLPTHLKYMHDIPYQSCLCKECLNFSLLVDALFAAKLQGVSHWMIKLVLQTLCSPRDVPAETVMIGDCHCDYIFRECHHCRFALFKQRLLEANPEFDFRCNVAWHQWVMEEERNQQAS